MGLLGDITSGLNDVFNPVQVVQEAGSAGASALGLSPSAAPGLEGVGAALATGNPAFATLGAGISSALGAASTAASTNAANAQIAAAQDQFAEGQANQAEAFSTQQTQAAEAYDTQMSDTQYQRGVADLEAAGLNPILAAGGANDSAPTISAPSPAVAPSYGYTAQPVPNVLSGAISSAMDLFSTLVKTQNTQADTVNKLLEPALTAAQTYSASASGRSSDASAAATVAKLPGIQAESDILSNRSTFEDLFPKLFGVADSISARLPFVNSGAQLAGAFN